MEFRGLAVGNVFFDSLIFVLLIVLALLLQVEEKVQCQARALRLIVTVLNRIDADEFYDSAIGSPSWVTFEVLLNVLYHVTN